VLLEQIIARRITGVRPFDELPINADIWREAHNHHHLHRALHAVSAHRPGILYGLEVFASPSRERTVVVAPGVAVDALGQVIVLAEPIYFPVTETRLIYFVLLFQRAVDRDSGVMVSGGEEYYREVEGRDVRQVKELPKGAFLELARLYRSAPDQPVRDAANPLAPGTDELSLLFRETAFPYCPADGGIGELAYVPRTPSVPWNPNRPGLVYLVRQARAEGFHLAFTGPYNLRDAAATAPALLYMAGTQGFQLSGEETDGLNRFLEDGGLLLAEASKGGTEFADAVRGLASHLGAGLKPVGAGHPLLTAHHVFPVPPPGGRRDGALEADTDVGIVLGTCDYGGAWQGAVDEPQAPDARERVRQATEFGLNVIAYAAQRQRRRALSRLG